MILNMAQLQKHIISWSDDTVRRKIKSAGFPAIQDEGGKLYFKRDDVLLWFKRREVQAG